jgi:hypothetical protein
MKIESNIKPISNGLYTQAHFCLSVSQSVSYAF